MENTLFPYPPQITPLHSIEEGLINGCFAKEFIEQVLKYIWTFNRE